MQSHVKSQSSITYKGRSTRRAHHSATATTHATATRGFSMKDIGNCEGWLPKEQRAGTRLKYLTISMGKWIRLWVFHVYKIL